MYGQGLAKILDMAGVAMLQAEERIIALTQENAALRARLAEDSTVDPPVSDDG